jgi:hypothetical protein
MKQDPLHEPEMRGANHLGSGYWTASAQAAHRCRLLAHTARTTHPESPPVTRHTGSCARSVCLAHTFQLRSQPRPGRDARACYQLVHNRQSAPPMSNTEVVIAMTGEIVLKHPLFTHELPDAVSPDDWRQLLDDIINADLQWSSSRRRRGSSIFG